MAKAKNCTPAQRKAIIELQKVGQSYQAIASQLNCSKTMVANAMSHFRRFKTTENVPRAKIARKTTVRIDRKIVRLSKANPKLSAVEINRQINDELDAPISNRTVARRLVEAGLHGRSVRKKPLVTAVQRKRRVEFALRHLEWRDAEWKFILWSDETKINRVGSDGKMYVRRPNGCAFDPRYVSPVVKHGGGSIMVWACFSWNGVGPIHRIQGNMDSKQYVDILKKVMLPWAEENLPLIWQFQQDNDPKHTSKMTKKFFEDQSIRVLEWASSSADLNPIEHLWTDVKKPVGAMQITNMDQLFDEVKKAWEAIPVERCRALIQSMSRRCAAVIKQKGFATKY